ncbi:MAG: hypothetical protein IJ381_08020 [Clostridia bacterium]|nr:hypothetical protein [Clostridia bacterium]
MNAEMCLIPLTLCSGTIEGAETWESHKALRQVMKSGKANDVRAAGAEILRDMSDPKKAKAYNEGMRRAEISARMGQILQQDNGEIGRLVSESIKAKKELNRLRERAQHCSAELEGARWTLRRTAEEITARVNAEAAKQYRTSREKIVRLAQMQEEYAAQIREKREEMSAAYEKAVSMAEGKAKREMMQDAERARKRRGEETPVMQM